MGEREESGGQRRRSEVRGGEGTYNITEQTCITEQTFIAIPTYTTIQTLIILHTGDTPLSFCDEWDTESNAEDCEAWCRPTTNAYYLTYNLTTSAANEYNVVRDDII